MMGLEQELVNMRAENRALEKENVRINHRYEELNKDYISVQQAFFDEKNLKQDTGLMFKFEKLEQDYKVLSCKHQAMERICNSYKTGLDKLYEDVNQKSKIIENYREQCSKLANDLIQERDKFINWSLQFSNKIESKMN